MGWWFLGQRKQPENEKNDYGKVLSQLDQDIKTIETKITKITLNRQDFRTQWTFYTFPIYLIYLLIYYFSLLSEKDLTLWIIYSSLLFVIPILIYFIRYFISSFYNRKRKTNETLLIKLKEQHKTKLDEMTERTGFNEIKKLVEKYDTPVKVIDSKEPHSVSLNEELGSNTPSKKSRFIDKLVDRIIGEENPQSKYALICSNCFTHNGLALPFEIASIKYKCMACGFLNCKGSLTGLQLKSRSSSSSMAEFEGMEQLKEELKKEV